MTVNQTLSRDTRWQLILLGCFTGLLLYCTDTASGLTRNYTLMIYVHSLAMAGLAILALAGQRLADRRLWLMTGATLIMVAIMAGWTRWNLHGLDEWQRQQMLAIYIFCVVLLLLLVIPLIQSRLATQTALSRDERLYHALWDNGLTLLLTLPLVGIFWGVLFLWAQLFTLVNINLFQQLFFDNRLFGYLATTTAAVTGIVLCRSQTRISSASKHFFTAIACGLLPLAAFIALLFLLTLPFVGLQALSARLSASGLLNTLALMLMLLASVVWYPQRAAAPWHRKLNLLVRSALIITPLYTLLAAWSLGLRVNQYGWSMTRLYAALITLALLVWSFCIAWQAIKGWHSGLLATGRVNLTLVILGVLLLLLVNSPLLDPYRISVNSHLARYQSGQLKANNVDLYMLQEAGRRGRQAMEILHQDKAWMADNERRRSLEMLLSQGSTSAATSVDEWKKQLLVAKGSPQPDESWWLLIAREAPSNGSQCLAEQGRCVLTLIDLNADGKNEILLCDLRNDNCVIYARLAGWQEKGWFWQVPESLKERFAQALRENRLKQKPKAWQDLEVDGIRLPVQYREE